LIRAISLYNIAGNHDVGNIPTPENLAACRQTFGKDYYSFRKGPMEGILLDSSIAGVDAWEKIVAPPVAVRPSLASASRCDSLAMR
jgi:hypothetical protein